ncbi:MAG: radical SAM protein [Polyangiaceae bacterium]|nr:radical SAM protein [Polyangiaceae bacterium]
MTDAGARTVLLFEELLPRPRAGDIEPCRALLETRGTRAGARVEVLLMDQGVALQALRQGGWAREQLDEALAREPHEFGLMDDAETTELSRWLALRPRADAGDPITIDDYGELTSALLLNGLRLTTRAGAHCHRPGVADPSVLDAAALRKTLERHAQLTEGLEPARARGLHLVGTRWLADAGRRAALEGAILQDGFHVTSVTVGDEPPHALLATLRWLVALGLRVAGRAPELGLLGCAPAEFARSLSSTGSLTLAALEHLDQALRELPAPEPLLRHSDDAARRACFAAIRESRARHAATEEARAVSATTQHLGPPSKWIRSYRQYAQSRRPRIVLIPTWQCELRCKYCRIPKQDGRVMSAQTIDRSLDLLFSAEGDELDLHFFGGEPLAAWDAIVHTLSTGHERARADGRTLRFLFTTNGWALTRERFDWLAGFPVWFQLSLDGDAVTQNAVRPALRVAGDSYDRSPATKARWFTEAGIAHDVVQVVHPTNVSAMAENFRHILGLGYSRIQLNYALGTLWDRPAAEEFGRQLARVGEELERRWLGDERAELVNLEETLLPVRGNLEVTVDSDGSVFGSSAFLVNTKHREDFRLGHLDDARSFDRYQCDGFEMDELLANWFSPEMAQNNRQVGAVLMSFIRYMRRKHPGLELLRRDATASRAARSHRSSPPLA